MAQTPRRIYLPERTPEEWEALRKHRLAWLERVEEHQRQIIARNGGKPLDIDADALLGRCDRGKDASNPW